MIARKIGRNEPCPCGSGERFKRCHGAIETQQSVSGNTLPLQADILTVLRQQQAHEISRRQRHGETKDVISLQVGGHRLVAVGNNFQIGADWLVFTDFLRAYLQHCLSSVWWDAEALVAPDQRHPVFRWFEIVNRSLDVGPVAANGLRGTSVGAASALFLLAYDLYVIKHNAELQGKLLSRIRHNDQFQGARFEATVAAAMLASGYDLTFADEKRPGKHPEFIAKNIESGIALAVEAKSKHRPGIFGFPGTKQEFARVDFGIRKLVKEAIEKNPTDPLIIFVELNAPYVMHATNRDALMVQLRNEWEAVQSESSLSHDFPCVGIIFFNDASGWFLEETLPDAGQWFASFPASRSRHRIDTEQILKRIEIGCAQRAQVPLEFPNGA